jgi:hypothetical protein
LTSYWEMWTGKAAWEAASWVSKPTYNTRSGEVD